MALYRGCFRLVCEIWVFVVMFSSIIEHALKNLDIEEAI